MPNTLAAKAGDAGWIEYLRRSLGDSLLELASPVSRFTNPVGYPSAIIALPVMILAAPAFAGSADAPAPDPIIATPAPVAPASPDWTGFYGGAQLGWGTADTNVAGSDDGFIGGLTGGYDYDLQNGFVVGAGLDYDFADIDAAPGITVEQVFRAKLRGCYKIGNGLL